jgi:hypothetical protein
MKASLYRATLFAMYQTSVALGLLLLPIAIVLRRTGLTLPVHRLVSGLGRAYEDAVETDR